MIKKRKDLIYALTITALSFGSLIVSEKIQIRFLTLSREYAVIILLMCTTVLIHAPALLPVAKMRQVFGRRFPVETLFPIGILRCGAFWA